MNEYQGTQWVTLILELLKKAYPQAKCELDYSTPFELLVAVILSAQCTDKRVNLVTPSLFAFANTAQKMSRHTATEVIPFIRSCGFYNNKANAIIECSKEIVSLYGGEVPQKREQLEALFGVGRKTANVVFAEAFGGNAIAVDTHVFRVSNRIGLANAKNVTETEKQLNAVIPEEEWSKAHHLLIFLGRYTCKAQNPMCDSCSLCEYCLYHNKK